MIQINLYSILPLTAFFANLFLAIFIIYRNPKNKFNNLYFLVAASIAAWAGAVYMQLSSLTAETALFWANIKIVFSSVSMAFLLHFFLIFTKNKLPERKPLLFLLYLPTLFFGAVASTTHLVLGSVEKFYWGFGGSGLLLDLHRLYLITYPLLGILLCYRFYSETGDKNERKQAKLFVAAVSVPLVGGLIWDVVLHYLGFQLVPITTLLTTAAVFIVTYSMKRYGLMTPISLSIQKKLTMVFFAIVLITGLSILVVGSVNSGMILEDRTNRLLESIALDKAEWVEIYVSERVKDVKVLVNSPSVKQTLNERITGETRVAKEEIRQKAKDVAGEIAEYLGSNPGMTVRDLQNDPGFQKIAVQGVGKTGYTAVHEHDTLINRFHVNPEIVDSDLHALQGKLPEFWDVIAGNKNGHDSEGTYDWEDADGVIREKYMYISVIEGETADGVSLSVAATTYLDEYEYTIKLLHEAEEYLQSFSESYGYSDMFLLSPEGEVLWTAEGRTAPGADIGTEPLNGTELAGAFMQAKSTDGPVISGCSFHFGDDTASFFIVTPVYEGSVVTGMVALQVSTDKINDVLADIKGVGSTGEAYLLNEDGYMITPSRFLNSTVLKLKVDTENSRNCLNADYGLGKHMGHEPVMFLENYMGDSVLGTHAHIPEVDWCLMVEVNNDEVFADYSRMSMNTLGIFIVLLLFGTLSSFMISSTISKPIIKLGDVASEIGKGNLSRKIKVTSNDEIGDLASAFNQMVSDLKSSRRKLKKYSRTLEKKVRMRTSKLKQNVKELEKAKKATLNMMEDMSEINKELKESQKKIKKANKELKKKDLLKSEFMNVGAHELKTPLIPIIGYLGMLKKDKKLNKHQKKEIGICLRNAKRLQVLVQDILDISKLESKAMKFNMKNLDVRSIVKNAIEDLKANRTEREVKLKKKITKKPLVVKGDEYRLTQVLENLMKNALKFTEDGSVTVEARKADSSAVVSVTDTGIGIAKKDIKKLFTKFFQVDTSAKRKHGGTGLGLAISKKIINKHKGKIWAESVLGKGSTFTFKLPLSKNRGDV